MPERVVLHIDFDYFYAQCEETRSPELKTKVVSVCIFSDRGNDSGAIATCNYIARKYGVKSGMPIKLAKQKLKDIPNTVFLPADFDFYTNVSSDAMEIIKKFGDVFEYVGKDEAYLDVTEKTSSDFKRAAHLSQQIKNEIREKTKLTCSIGVSPNKLIAKIASNYKKPDGLTIVTPEKISEFLESLKIRDIPGIGKQTEKKFLEIQLETINQVKKLDIFTLNSKFGKKIASFIFNAVRGIDNDPVAERSPTIQYSKISTLRKDSKEFEFLLENLKESCKKIHIIILKHHKMFKSIGIQFVQSDLTNKTKSKMLKNPTSSLEELEKTAEQLLRIALENQTVPIRRIGVKVSELSEIEGQSNITNFF